MRRQTVIVRPEASHDAMSAARWYENRLGGLGIRFLNELDEAINAIDQHPLRYPVYHRDIRKLRLERFPYAAFYAARDGRIVVLGVLHLHRNPRSIRKKLRKRH
jgi:toxin ParE1/3/4